MGWTSFNDMPGLTTGEILTREMSGTNADGVRWSIVDQSTRPGVWYALACMEKSGSDPVFYGLVCLFKRSKKTGEFSYKDMSEDVGPFYYDCPVRILDKLDQLAPNPGALADGWRVRCRAKHAEKKKPMPVMQPGYVVKLATNSSLFELVQPAGPRRGWIVKLLGGSGMVYRATAKQIKNATIVRI